MNHSSSREWRTFADHLVIQLKSTGQCRPFCGIGSQGLAQTFSTTSAQPVTMAEQILNAISGG